MDEIYMDGHIGNLFVEPTRLSFKLSVHKKYLLNTFEARWGRS